MISRRHHRVRFALAAALTLLAAASATAARPGRHSQDAVRKAFDDFLRGSLEQPGWVPLDTTLEASGIGCSEDGDHEFQRYLWVARYRIVSVTARGGRGAGVVDVLAAAEQRVDSIPVRRVAHHVLRFEIRRIETGAWRVCGRSDSGWRLGPGVVLQEYGFDKDPIYATIDSIRGVPHRRWFPRRDEQ